MTGRTQSEWFVERKRPLPRIRRIVRTRRDCRDRQDGLLVAQMPAMPAVGTSARWGYADRACPRQNGKVPCAAEGSHRTIVDRPEAEQRDLVLAILSAAPRRRGEDRALPRGARPCAAGPLWLAARPSPAWPEAAGLGPAGRRSLPQATMILNRTVPMIVTASLHRSTVLGRSMPSPAGGRRRGSQH